MFQSTEDWLLEEQNNQKIYKDTQNHAFEAAHLQSTILLILSLHISTH